MIYLGDEASPIGVVAMPGGMASGRTSISMRLDLPDGRVVIVETALYEFGECGAANSRTLWGIVLTSRSRHSYWAKEGGIKIHQLLNPLAGLTSKLPPEKNNDSRSRFSVLVAPARGQIISENVGMSKPLLCIDCQEKWSQYRYLTVQV